MRRPLLPHLPTPAQRFNVSWRRRYFAKKNQGLVYQQGHDKATLTTPAQTFYVELAEVFFGETFKG